jgi:hypothetical protein
MPAIIRLQAPRLIDMSRGYIGILKTSWSSLRQMRKASLVVFPRVNLWIVVPDPASNLEETYLSSVGIGFDRLCICGMQLLSIQKSCLLKYADSLEPVS